MTSEPRKYPPGLWVLLIAALAGCVFGILYGLFKTSSGGEDVNVLVTIAKYTVGFGLGGIITGLIAGLALKYFRKSGSD